MKRALIVYREKDIQELKPILPLANYQVLAKTENGIDGLKLAQRLEPDLIITGWDIKGLAPYDFLQNIVDSRICPVLLILDQKDQHNLSSALKTNVQSIICVPIRAVDIVTGIIQAEYRFLNERENADQIRKLNDEIKTRKILFQAILMMIPMGYDEEKAYAAIRKKAMSTRKTIRSVAIDVIKGAEI
ncbi:MAG: ANTAR domain-containing protein [Eubacteriales bacterium]